MRKSLLPVGTLIGVLTVSLVGPAGAVAASVDSSSPSTAVASVSPEPIDDEELAQTLQTLFEDVIPVDEQGVISFDEEAATKLLGAKTARELGQQVAEGRSAALISQGPGVGVRAAASTSFVDCMVQGSVLGLVGGVTSGVYLELIREREWNELAKRLAPRLAKAGVAGGAAGIAAGLAVSAVQCSFFRD